MGGIALVTSWSVFASCRAELRLFTRDREQLIPSSATCGESPQSCRICSALHSLSLARKHSWEEGAVKEHSVYDAYLCVCVYVSKDIYVYSLFISKQKIEDPNLAVFGVEGETSRVGGEVIKTVLLGSEGFLGILIFHQSARSS